MHSGLRLHNEEELDQRDRIHKFIQEKFMIDDIGKLKMLPENNESDSQDDDDEDDIRRADQPDTLEELYDIIGVVGAGSFGIVIACRDRSSKKRFALKIAAQNHHQASVFLRREKIMLSKMNHPNIIRVQEMTCKYKNLDIMKMELGKETISQFLERHQRQTGEVGLPEDICTKIMKGVF